MDREPGINKVLFFGIDGLRADTIPAGHMRNLERLIVNGVYTDAALAPDTSWSGPGWASVFTGVERDKHGVVNNAFTGFDPVRFPHWLTLIKQRKPELTTAYAYNWRELYSKLLPVADLRHEGSSSGTDERLIVQAEGWLRDKPELDVLSAYVRNVDDVGHAHGYHADSVPYIAALGQADAHLGRLLTALQARPSYVNEHWLIIVTTDHGGASGHGRNFPEHRKTMVAMAGPEIAPLGRNHAVMPIRQVDVLPTVFEHLGISIDGLDLDGRSRARVQRPRFVFGANLLANPDASYGSGHRDTDYDPDVPGWIKGGKQTVMPYGANSDLPTGSGHLFVGLDRGSLTQRIELPLDTVGRAFSLKALVGATKGSGHDARVIVRFRTGARRCAVRLNDQIGYFFSNDRYYRFDYRNNQVEPGYPKPIAADWLGLEQFSGGARDIDTALNVEDGKIYFFKDDQFIRFDLASNKADAGYPRPIAHSWPGLERFTGGARNLDAVVVKNPGTLYFFKASQFIRYNFENDSGAQAKYPSDISVEYWKGIEQWPSGIDAAVNRNSTSAYLFNSGEYVRFQWSPDEGGYPLPINSSSWTGLVGFTEPGTFFATSSLSGNERDGQLHLRGLSGKVPPGALSVEVELRLDTKGGRGFSFADELELIIA